MGVWVVQGCEGVGDIPGIQGVQGDVSVCVVGGKEKENVTLPPS